MKILFVSPVGSLSSGAEVAIVNLMKLLSDQGHQIFNVIPDNEANKDLKYLELMQKSDIHTFQIKTIKWWWYEFPNPHELGRGVVLASQHANIVEIRRIIQDEEIDLVISNTANVFQGALAAALEEVPHYYIIHEFPFGEFEYYKEKVDFINQLSQKIFVVSGELYKHLKRYFLKEKLIPFIPTPELSESKLQISDKNRIVSIGRITDRKNQLELIKAFHKLNRPGLELILIGGWDEEYKSICDDYIEKHQISNISFLGYQDKPWMHVTNKDIAVFTSKLETFGLVVVESLLNGVPTIFSNNPGHKSVRDYLDYGCMYDLGNTEQLSNILEEWLDHFDSLKKEAERNIQAIRERFSIDETSQVFLDNLQISNLSKNTITLNEISSLIGFELPYYAIEYLKGQNITIFLGDENGRFNTANSFIFELKEKGNFTFNVESSKIIRIDLSENPAVFKNVMLVSEESEEVIEPIHSNGTIEGNNYIFFENDPQLIYDLSETEEKIFNLSYEYVPGLIEDVFRENMHKATQKLTEVQNDLDFTRKTLQQSEEKYTELLHDYNSVIHSRRWTIPTAIINFFRRKK